MSQAMKLVLGAAVAFFWSGLAAGQGTAPLVDTKPLPARVRAVLRSVAPQTRRVKEAYRPHVLRFTEDGKFLDIARSDWSGDYYPIEVMRWDTTTWKEAGRSVLDSAKQEVVTASPDHAVALVAAGEFMLRFVDRVEGKDLGCFFLERPDFLVNGNGSFISPCRRFCVVRGTRDDHDAQWCFAIPWRVLFKVPPRNSFDQWAFSADGKRAALFESTGWLSIRDTATGTILRLLDEPVRGWRPSDTTSVLVFAPAGPRLATWDSDRDDVRIWNVETGRLLAILPARLGIGTKTSRIALAWSADGQMLATTSAGGKTIQLWETATAKLRREWQRPDDTCDSLAISPDGRLLGCGNEDSTVVILGIHE
jgi:hypothetical protein